MPTRIAAVWGAAALAVLGSSIVQADVADFLDKPVTAVLVRREGRTVSDAKFYDVIETKPGQTLAMAAVRETIEHLFGFGIFEDVRVEATSTPSGVLLTYDVVPLHPVMHVAFTGTDAPGIDEGHLRRIVAERFGFPLRVGRGGEITRALEDGVRDVGYLHPRVTFRTDVEHTTEQSTMFFGIEPGERTHIGTVDVQGTPGVPAAELLSRLDLVKGAPYEREALRARLDRFLDGRRSRGYYGARASITPTFADDDRTVNLTIAVTVGPLVRVVFKGDSLPPKRRDELVPIERDGSADEDLLEDSTNRVEEYLRAQGYRDASAPHEREEVDGELLVTFTVKRGPLYRVARVELSGNVHFSSSALMQGLRLREGQPFSTASLAADLTTIEDMYHREGFASVQVQPSSEALVASGAADVPVAVKIEITENTRTVVGAVEIRGNEHVPDARLREGLSLQAGKPYVSTRLAADRDAIQLAYANLGYPNVAVDSNPGLGPDGTGARVVFTVHEGPQMLVEHILVVGNVRTKTDTIERELQFKSGGPLGAAAVSESQRRLVALGLFRRVRIAELRHGDGTHRDVLVSVEEAPLTTLGYGGGFEVRKRVVRSTDQPDVATDQIEFAPRASFEIGRRNLFGRNRSVNLFASAALYPTDSLVFANQAPVLTEAGGFGFPEYRVIGQFREPRVFGSADLRVTATLEQQIRSSFNFTRRGVSAELARRLTSTVSVSGSYQVQRTHVFDQSVAPENQRLVDRIFPNVLLSSFSGSIIRDTSDDLVDATRGQYLSLNGQLAARAIGSEVGFFKTYLTAKTFHPVTQSARVVLAGNARLGMAVGFLREIIQTDDQNNPLTNITRDLPASERFYAGGDTTMRGFALDQLGVRHIPPQPSDTIDASGFPLGGNGLVLFNGEARLALRGGLGVVGFVDTGNVFKRVVDIDLSQLRTALGFGLRYKSPVGPIRVDLGFKANRRDYESLTAWFVTFGQAF